MVSNSHHWTAALWAVWLNWGQVPFSAISHSSVPWSTRRWQIHAVALFIELLRSFRHFCKMSQLTSRVVKDTQTKELGNIFTYLEKCTEYRLPVKNLKKPLTAKTHWVRFQQEVAPPPFIFIGAARGAPTRHVGIACGAVRKAQFISKRTRRDARRFRLEQCVFTVRIWGGWATGRQR